MSCTNVMTTAVGPIVVTNQDGSRVWFEGSGKWPIGTKMYEPTIGWNGPRVRVWTVERNDGRGYIFVDHERRKINDFEGEWWYDKTEGLPFPPDHTEACRMLAERLAYLGKRFNRPLKVMAELALIEHREGRTRPFPPEMEG